MSSSSNKPIKVWYHGNCDDGYGAAWAVYQRFKQDGKLHEVEFTPVHYNKPHPAISMFPTTDVIYIVDFAYDRKTIENLRSMVGKVIVLDHHKSHRQELEGLEDCVFDMDRSGAVITWNYFHTTPVPLLLRYIQANDLWKHATMKRTKEIIRYIRSFPKTFEYWDTLDFDFRMHLPQVIENAIAIERFFTQQVQHLKPLAKTVWFKGYTCAVVNNSYVFTSELCHDLIKELGTEIALSYHIKEDNVVSVSLRGNGEVDVSAIAKQYPGGGGHNDAAGFVTDLAHLCSILYYTNVKETS